MSSMRYTRQRSATRQPPRVEQHQWSPWRLLILVGALATVAALALVALPIAVRGLG